MERQPWTHDDLERAVRAAQDLSAVGVWAVHTDPTPEPVCHVSSATLVQVVALAGATPTVQAHRAANYWDASVVVEGVRFSALFRPEELPLIGYQVTPLPEPVMLVEEAETDG